MGKPVVWAVKAENLKAVAENLRRFNPERKIVIAATDAPMAKGNRPIELAQEAANAVRATLVVPPSSQHDRARNVTSFGEILRHGKTSQVEETLYKAGLKFTVLFGRTLTQQF